MSQDALAQYQLTIYQQCALVFDMKRESGETCMMILLIPEIARQF